MTIAGGTRLMPAPQQCREVHACVLAGRTQPGESAGGNPAPRSKKKATKSRPPSQDVQRPVESGCGQASGRTLRCGRRRSGWRQGRQPGPRGSGRTRRARRGRRSPLLRAWKRPPSLEPERVAPADLATSPKRRADKEIDAHQPMNGWPLCIRMASPVGPKSSRRSARACARSGTMLFPTSRRPARVTAPIGEQRC